MRMVIALGVASLLAAVPALAADPPARTPMTRDTGAPVGDNQNSKTAGLVVGCRVLRHVVCNHQNAGGLPRPRRDILRAAPQ